MGTDSQPLLSVIRTADGALDFASWKDRKQLAAALKPIYTAINADAAAAELDAFEQGPWGKKFPTVDSGQGTAKRLAKLIQAGKPN